MSLDFTKLTYVDGETVIGADNLNKMQDAILDLDVIKVEKEQGKGLSENDYTDADKQKVDDAYVVPDGGIPKSTLSDAVQTSLGKADTALQEDDLAELIAPLEETYTASRNYAVGSYLFVGTKFYKVTSAIQTGGTINPGTNVTQTTVAEQLITLAVKPAILG